MSETQADLDNSITALTTAVEALVAKLNSVPQSIDFAPEVTQLQKALADAQAALNPPPIPPIIPAA